jgi:vancomycin resistance protein YoaR
MNTWDNRRQAAHESEIRLQILRTESGDPRIMQRERKRKIHPQRDGAKVKWYELLAHMHTFLEATMRESCPLRFADIQSDSQREENKKKREQVHEGNRSWWMIEEEEVKWKAKCDTKGKEERGSAK